ncbi:cytochrome ubiquinol oxidase subunit I [Microbacterium sp. LWH3-1.2]|uniref:cytochrome ubiquinol oxidase subunit I n=1 Tax=Microbacterium sp. LWH3-1.2 TaxID=3135256 RepID=UPI0034299FD2
MDPTDLARLQFASTSIYHFFFVPVTIGLAFLTAILHTRWYRTRASRHERLTRFFGTLLLINVAIGVVTGLVQEFQFGMNWSAYSVFVGDVFGAPLAMEGLAAFFLESTFLGLWVFGWKVLPRRLHLLSAWLVAAGAALSAAFIMAANSWMQHPVGYTADPETGRPTLSSIGDLFTNPVFIWSYIHVILAALVTGAVVMLAVSAWQLRRGHPLFKTSALLSLAVLVPSTLLQLGVGSQLGVIETTYQPMKIAAAEAQWETCQPCSFSLFQVGGFESSDQEPIKIIQVPHLLSLLATLSWDGEVVGLDELQAQDGAEYGTGDYVPDVRMQYWSMRVMAYLGTLFFLFSLWGVWLAARRTLPVSRVFLFLATWSVPLLFLMNTAGWMLTESGRQPWVVQGLMKTADGVSSSVSAAEVVISLVAFYAVFLLLLVLDIVLMLRFARRDLDASEAESPSDSLDAPALTY